MRATFVLLLTAALAFAEDTSTSSLTARQLYYKTRTKPATSAPVKPKSNTTGAMPVTTATEAKATPVAISSQAPYLGLRYSILDGISKQEIDPGKSFHSGDSIRLSLHSNSDGFLYIFSHGSSGAWRTLFPSAEIVNNNNQITKDQVTEIPSAQNFEFEAEPGMEKLVVVLSREREDAGNLLNLVQKGEADSETAPPSGRVMQAENRTPKDLELLRNKLVGRDLRVQAVHSGANKAGENAVYVAASHPATSLVVTKINLKHE